MLELRECDGNLAVEASEQKGMVIYLWFYEWSMFDAMRRGQHTACDQQFSMTVSFRQDRALVGSDSMKLACNSAVDGVELSLTLTNKTDYEWPEVSGIVPCLNPGRPKTNCPPVNQLFTDYGRTRTFFFGSRAFELLKNREIHFNRRLRSAIDQISDDGIFVFSNKWPTSQMNTEKGILIRESEDRQWVSGIAWEDFLFVQGHNPRECMHVCIRVGSLKPSDTRTIRGKIYLFKGRREDCLRKYLEDFQESLCSANSR